uniref:Uncharacterized protein n=1 Tax=Podarcis muralis TaxID=64176 RepID=A0A670ILF4_PODMU
MGIWAKGLELLLASFQPPLGQGASCAAIMISKLTGPTLARTPKEVPTKLPPSQLPFQTHSVQCKKKNHTPCSAHTLHAMQLHTPCNAKNTLRAVHTLSLQCSNTLCAMQKTHSVQCTDSPCNVTTHSVQCNYTLRAMQLHTPCNAKTRSCAMQLHTPFNAKHTPWNAHTLHAMQLNSMRCNYTPCNATTHSMHCTHPPFNAITYSVQCTHTVQCKNTLCAMQKHALCNATTHSVQCNYTLPGMHTPSMQCN